MSFQNYCQRADLIGASVVTRDSARKLGVVSQIWVDVDRREVVAFGVRENILSGVVNNIQQVLPVKNTSQIGDVVLVETSDVMDEDFRTDSYSTLVNSEVVTETGDLLGRVRGFKFDPLDGRVESIIIASFGLPQIPDQVLSTYELGMSEVVSSGPDRLIVFEGSEEKLNQLSVGFLERIGIGKPPWEKDSDDIYVRPAAPSNQLPSGMKTPLEPIRQPIRERDRTPIAQETWDDDHWAESQPKRKAQAMRPDSPAAQSGSQPRGNWSDDPDASGQRSRNPNNPWEDDENPRPNDKAQELKMPEKKRVVEYEDDPDY
jgi:sporulation protein YlmC with PRC-barrel domain